MCTPKPLAALALLAFAGTANAQLQYQFADGVGTVSSTFTVPVGGAVSVRVYLRDTTPGAPTLSADGGLGAAAVRVSYTNAGAASISNLTTDAVPAVPPWDFGTTTGSVANASAVLNNGVDISPQGVLPSADRIFVGTFTFTGNAVGTSSLTAADPNPANGLDTSYFNTGLGLDGLISSSTATVTVVPVPEPGALLGVAAVVLCAGGVLRRRARAG